MHPSFSTISAARLLKYLLLLTLAVLLVGVCRIEVIYLNLSAPVESLPYHVAAYCGLVFSSIFSFLLTGLVIAIPFAIFAALSQRVSYAQYEEGILKLLLVLLANEVFKAGVVGLFLPHEVQAMVPDGTLAAALKTTLSAQIAHNADAVALALGTLLMAYYWLSTRAGGVKPGIIVLASFATWGATALLNSLS